MPSEQDQYDALFTKLCDDLCSGVVYEDMKKEVIVFLKMYSISIQDLMDSVCARRMLQKFLQG